MNCTMSRPVLHPSFQLTGDVDRTKRSAIAVASTSPLARQRPFTCDPDKSFTTWPSWVPTVEQVHFRADGLLLGRR